ncbi:MAG: 3'-5' exonuclease [Planctomycetes bacterium]|nr:3'-5' exonuclease [Planctomycetota bacterium]
MTKLLVIDTETGGLDPARCSLLTLGAVVWEDGRIVAESEWLVRETRLEIEPASLKEHQVDLREAAAKGRPPAEVAHAFLDFARPHFPGEKIAVAGHNIGFDVGFLKRLFAQAGADYEGHFSHRLIDTSSILGVLALAGRIAIKSRGLSEAIAYFQLPVDAARRHTALEDARVTALLLTKLVDLLRAG